VIGSTVHKVNFKNVAVAIVSASVTVSSAVVPLSSFGFTATQLAQAKHALITSTKAAVRYMYDGTAPTSELGHILPMDASPPLDVIGMENVANLQFILDSGAATDAIVLITLEG